LADAVGDLEEVAKVRDVRVVLWRFSPDHRATLFEMYYPDITARQAAAVLGGPRGRSSLARI